MAITVDATYENGILRPAQPLPLAEHEQVRVTIQPQSNQPQSNQPQSDPVEATYGIVGWKGSHEDLALILEKAEG